MVDKYKNSTFLCEDDNMDSMTAMEEDFNRKTKKAGWHARSES